MDLFLLTILLLSFYRPSLVASYDPSSTPEPLFTSVLYGYYYLHHCRQILTSGEGILVLRSSAAPTCSYQSPPAPPTSSSFRRSMVLQELGCDMEYDMVCTMRHAMISAMCDEGIAFFDFFGGMLSWYRCSDGILDWEPGRYLGRTGLVVNT